MSVAPVLVVGTGLIGGSVGLSLRAAGRHVVGFDADPQSAARALERGAVDRVVADLAEGAGNCGVVVICTPVAHIVPTVEKIAATARAGTVVTDTGSAKASVVSEAESAAGPAVAFVGGHPMAGTEGEGIEAARAALFRDALWILTPTASTSQDALHAVRELASETGARTVSMDPAEHDRIVAVVSHLPYAVATVLMAMAAAAPDDLTMLAAAGSFRDVTRTAGSNPSVWRDILRSNRDAVVEALAGFEQSLASFRQALAQDDWAAAEAVVAGARAGRRRIPWKGERGPSEPVTIEVVVADRTGVLAELTSALGERGVNIEDLWMDHTRAEGVVFLVVDGLDVAGRAISTLQERGFQVVRVGEP